MVQTAIWQDDDFLDLSPDAKVVYLMLLTQPTVSTCGVLSLRFKHWSRLLGMTPRRLIIALGHLATAGFTLDDPDAEEIWIRSWIKHNIGENRKMVIAARDQYHAIYSQRIKDRLVEQYPDVFEAIDAKNLIPDTEIGDRVFLENENARGMRYEERGTYSNLFSSSDLEKENDDWVFERLLDAMGKRDDQQVRLELQSFRGRGASELDFESVRAGVEKARPKYVRAYVVKALERRLAARGAA